MAIEFQCEKCGKSLKTSDDKAGRRGACPECRAPLVVPAPASFFREDDRSRHERIESVDDYEEREPGDDRFAARRRSQACPMCGAENMRSASRCSHCGEDLQPGLDRTRQSEDGNQLIFSQIFNQTISRFESNIGICIGGVLLSFVLMFFTAVVLQLFLVIVGTGLIGLLRNPGDVAGAILVIVILGILAIAVLNFWFVLGLNRFLLRLARTGTTTIAELFAVSLPMVWTMTFNTFVFGALVAGVMIGTVILISIGVALSPIIVLLSACIGFILYLMLVLSQWCYPYVIVDRNPTGLGAMTTTFRLMSGNYLTMFLVFLCLAVLNMIGALLFGIGLLFTIPFSMLMLGVAYDQMTHSESI